MDGYTLGRELRSRLSESPPVLIALTGYGRDQDRLRSEEAGFLFHLVKPIDTEELIRLLEKVTSDLSASQAG
jgi:CheY-like chemotaxis protein